MVSIAATRTRVRFRMVLQRWVATEGARTETVRARQREAAGQLAALPPSPRYASVDTPTDVVESERAPVVVMRVPLDGR